MKKTKKIRIDKAYLFTYCILLILVSAVYLELEKFANNNALADTAPAIAASSGQTNSYMKVPVLMYHHIADVKFQNPYFVSPKIFDQQMAWLKNNGYSVISYSRFYGALTGSSTLPANPVVLTFDDGDRDQYENAFPVLKKYGYTATFFIITGAVGEKYWMTWDMIKVMTAGGMDMESHTVHHPDLAKMNTSSIKFELATSRSVLEKELGRPVVFFAYPGGAHSVLDAEILKETGYLSAVTTRHWIWHSKKESPYLVPRVHIDNDLWSFIQIMNGVKLN